MKREDPRHEEESLVMARKLLKQVGYSENEIVIVVDDAISKHGCHGNIRPATLEGKAMVSADGIAHLVSDFYKLAEDGKLGVGTPIEVADWALPKLDRDFHNKIAYDGLREQVKPAYLKLKAHFEALLATQV